ncbi:MAG: dihydrodipicolinate synthase family protein [archaeon]
MSPVAQTPVGLIVPLITPLNEDKSVDEVALKVLTARLMNKGVRNFLVLGAYSEQEFLLPEQKQKVLEIVSQEVNGKGLMIVGCFGSSSDEIISSVIEVQKYTNLVLVNVPLPSLERELEFIDFFDSLFTQTQANILLYNNALVYKKSIPALWLDNIINWERLVGVIDYSRNPDYLDELGKYHHFSKLFEENEELAFDAMRRNFSGLACISAIAFPSYYVSMIEDFEQIDYSKMIRLEAKISTIIKMLPANKKIQAFKYALSLQHLIQPYYSDQLENLSSKEKNLVEQAFGIKQELIQNR